MRRKPKILKNSAASVETGLSNSTRSAEEVQTAYYRIVNVDENLSRKAFPIIHPCDEINSRPGEFKNLLEFLFNSLQYTNSPQRFHRLHHDRES